MSVYELPDGADWQEWLQENRSLLQGSFPATAITGNATVNGRPAFFHFDPATGQTGDIVHLIFAQDGQLFQLFFHGGTLPPLEAEARIFRQMLESFAPPSGAVGITSIPMGWEQGTGLVISPAEPAATGVGADRLELTGIIEELGTPGNDVMLADDGQRYDLISLSRYYWRGLPIDYERPPEATMNHNTGDRVRVVGTRLAPGELLLEYFALEREGAWQPLYYKSLFDLSRDEVAPALLAFYPQDAPASLWLYGLLAEVLPFLVDENGEPIPSEPYTSRLESPTLARGRLQSADNPRVALEELYGQEGECEVVTAVEMHCSPWQQLVPTPSTALTIMATVLSADPEARVVVLEQPVEGFVTITLASDGQLLTKDGAAATWDTLPPGTSVQATGEVGPAGTLLARQITLYNPQP